METARARPGATLARRFYKQAVAAPDSQHGGFAILLDGRPLRTPGKRPLTLPSDPLARAIAEEWADQGETIQPHTMPLTQLANTAVERVAPNPEAVIDALLDHLDGDVLCYRASGPATLAERQARDWQPVVDWAENALGLTLAITEGLMPARQPPETRHRLATTMADLDPWSLTTLQAVASAAGSWLLATALIHDHLDGERCFALSRLDELWQAERWGDDREARLARDRVRTDILAAERFRRLARR
jgi:chaperone required for assembly of F1-ATPase